MMKHVILLLGLVFLNTDLLATERVYQADIEGMVCAFCVYSVSRDLAGIPGVDADSIDVDLDNGKVIFKSTELVPEATLRSIFEDTGFRITTLTELDAGSVLDNNVNYQLVLSLTITESAPSVFDALFESVGTLAANNLSRIVLTAPVRYEEELLKPILMGRQQAMKLHFVPAMDEAITLQLFLAVAEN